MTEDRICRKCDEPLPLNEDNFHRNKRLPGGFEFTCKSCKNEYYAEYRSFPRGEYRSTRRRDTGFDEACERDILKRIGVDNISIYQDAF